jgi:hypothetical protein
MQRSSQKRNFSEALYDFSDGDEYEAFTSPIDTTFGNERGMRLIKLSD